jgi:hypothetical protein
MRGGDGFLVSLSEAKDLVPIASAVLVETASGPSLTLRTTVVALRKTGS